MNKIFLTLLMAIAHFTSFAIDIQLTFDSMAEYLWEARLLECLIKECGEEKAMEYITIIEETSRPYRGVAGFGTTADHEIVIHNIKLSDPKHICPIDKETLAKVFNRMKTDYDDIYIMINHPIGGIRSLLDEYDKIVRKGEYSVMACTLPCGKFSPWRKYNRDKIPNLESMTLIEQMKLFIERYAHIKLKTVYERLWEEGWVD